MTAILIETHSFDTVTLTNKQFLTGLKDGTPARIGGVLQLPARCEKVPGVLLVHGSDGIGVREHDWSQVLNDLGVASFILDSFTGRGIVETITDQSRLGHLGMIFDAYRALDLLAGHPQIDASRIAIMGFSKGGFVALYSSMRRFQRCYGPANLDFGAYIAFYARCDIRYLDDEDLSDHPIRLFHGTADGYVPIDSCRRYVDRLRRAGKDVTLMELPGAHHAFDNPFYQKPVFMPDAEVPNRCRREEGPGGIIINLETGLPFTTKDACVTYGATLAYNAHAHEESVRAVGEFLRRLFRVG